MVPTSPRITGPSPYVTFHNFHGMCCLISANRACTQTTIRPAPAFSWGASRLATIFSSQPRTCQSLSYHRKSRRRYACRTRKPNGDSTLTEPASLRQASRESCTNATHHGSRTGYATAVVRDTPLSTGSTFSRDE